MSEPGARPTLTAPSGGRPALDPASASAPARGGRRALVPLGLAAFITSLDTTVTTVAVVPIQNDLGLSLNALEWVATSYVLAFASLLLVGGRLTDLAGRRMVLLSGMWLFAGASVTIALASGTGTLLLGRAVQGAGAALVTPAVLAVIAADLTDRDRHLGSGVFSASIAGALALGPLFGGAVSQYGHWTWIFWMNVPFILGTALTVRWAIPRTAARPVAHPSAGPAAPLWQRLDLPGLLLTSTALLGATFVLLETGELGFGSWPVLTAFAAAVGGLVGAVLAERRAAYPLMDLEMLRHRVVAGGAGVQVLWGLGINGVFFFTSVFLQRTLGLSSSQAGLGYVPLAGSLILFVPLVPRLVAAWGPHRVTALGMMAVAGGLVAVSLVGPGDGLVQLLPGFLLLGIGTALTTPITSAVLEVVPPERTGAVAAVISVAREISGVLGVAVIAAILSARKGTALRAGLSQQEAFLSGYRTGLLTAAALAVLGGVIAYRTLGAGAARLSSSPASARPAATGSTGGSPPRARHAHAGQR